MMKRLLLLLLLICFPFTVFAAEELRGWNQEEGYVYVAFGSFPQTIEGGSPEDDYNTWKWARNPIKDSSELEATEEPILWRVLCLDDGRPYLCSEYVLFAAPVHVNVTEYKTIGSDFRKTDLSGLLNTFFLEKAFTAEEQAMIFETDEFGKIGVPSAEDLSTKSERAKAIGFRPTSETKVNGIKALGTEYAIRTDRTFREWAEARAETEGNAESWAEKYRADHDKAYSYVVATKYGAHSLYWTRNQSDTDVRHGRDTKEKGQLGHIIANRMNLGVRPVLYLDPEKVEIASGTGTKDDPFIPVALK